MTSLTHLKIRLAVVVHSLADRYPGDPDIERLRHLHTEVEIGETVSLAVTAAQVVRLKEVRQLRDRHLPFKSIAAKLGVSRQHAGRLYKKATA